MLKPHYCNILDLDTVDDEYLFLLKTGDTEMNVGLTMLTPVRDIISVMYDKRGYFVMKFINPPVIFTERSSFHIFNKCKEYETECGGLSHKSLKPKTPLLFLERYYTIPKFLLLRKIVHKYLEKDLLKVIFELME